MRTGAGLAEFDDEGRYIEARFGNLSVVSLYLPSGSSARCARPSSSGSWTGSRRSSTEWRASGREYVLCGDWNIAHTPIDIKNWRCNQKNSGFLPEERAWLAGCSQRTRLGRRLPAAEAGRPEYTWWTKRGAARANNVGWRIDYQVVSPSLRDRLQGLQHHRQAALLRPRPLPVDYEL